jgi:hypothetical protein
MAQVMLSLDGFTSMETRRSRARHRHRTGSSAEDVWAESGRDSAGGEERASPWRGSSAELPTVCRGAISSVLRAGWQGKALDATEGTQKALAERIIDGKTDYYKRGHGREEIRSYMRMPWRTSCVDRHRGGVCSERRGEGTCVRDGKEKRRPSGARSRGNPEELPFDTRHELPLGRVAHSGSARP